MMILDVNNINFPLKLNAPPIVEAIVEIRFSSEFSPVPVIDKLLIEFGKDYPTSKDLPLSQFPSQLREQDPQLRYLPVKQLIKDKLILQIGGQVLSVVNKSDYLGWTALKGEVKKIIDQLITSKIVSQYEKLGIRYLNAFDYNILDKINLSISGSGKHICDGKVDLRFMESNDAYQAVIKISTNIRKMVKNEITTASLIDIDVFTKDFREDQLMDLIEGAHLFEKKLFFALMKKDFIEKQFKPTWSE